MLRVALSAILMAGSASAQDSLPVPEARAVRPDRAAVPFGVGERSEYQVKFGKFSVGSGSRSFST